MPVNVQSKEVLARLLATENINVEHRNTSTAMFDVVNRNLILPTWENMNEHIYDMFVGHEVGHALFTPTDIEYMGKIMKDIDADNEIGVKTIFNIVEDARIEKKMKRKFPGLKRDFRDGYKSLIDDGTLPTSAAKHNFLDRLNLHFKAGSLISDIKFNDMEQIYVDRADKAETFDEVHSIVADMYNMVKNAIPDMPDDMLMEALKSENGDNSNEQNQDNQGSGKETEADKKDGDSDQNDVGSDGDSSGDSAKQDQGDSQNGKDGKDGKDGEEKGNEDGKKRTPGNLGSRGAIDPDSFKSKTQEALSEYSEKHYDALARTDKTISMPKVDCSRYMQDYKSVLSELQQFYSTELLTNEWFIRELSNNDMDFESYMSSMKQEYKSWRQVNKSNVNYMAKEFEMKKSADQYARSAQSKTGVLNTNKMHSYKFDDDIFRRVTVLPDGKNHAMMMIIDWSGSMDNSLANTVHQLLTMILFCKKVNIPFEVFNFTDNGAAYRDHIKPLKSGDYQVNDLFIDHHLMRNMFSSRMSNKELEMALEYFFYVAKGYSYGDDGFYPYQSHKHLIPDSWDLSGTPLNDSIMVMRDFLERYRKENKDTIINLIYLTDGDSASSTTYITDNEDGKEIGNSNSYSYGWRPVQMSKEEADEYDTRLYVDVKYDGINFNSENIKIKDPYTNISEYITPKHGENSQKQRWQWGYKSEYHNMTNALLRSIGRMPRVNLIGFYVVGSRYELRNCSDSHFHYNEMKSQFSGVHEWDYKSVLNKRFKKDKYIVNENHKGYDIFFGLAGGDDLKLESEGLSDDLQGESKRKLTTAFKKHSKAKLQSRVFLTKFIDFISKENF